MKILHCCLAAFYIDNYGYQENIITRMHKKQGHDVMILASTESLDKEKGYVYVKPSSYKTPEGIPVVRLPYVHIISDKISQKLRIYNGVYKAIESFKPDIIFMHDAQTAAVFPIVKYIRKNPNVRLYIDSHTDEINSAHGWISKNILHRIIYKIYVRHTIQNAQKYYGTLPARVNFYKDFYGTPNDKMDFLPMGIDDESINFCEKDKIRFQIRKELDIKNDDFVLITGGKIDLLKNVHILMDALADLKYPNVKLIVFGSIKKDVEAQIKNFMKKDKRIIYTGWLPSNETYKYFFASDLACFLGTHSTLWEESVGYGIPGIFKKWNGITHVDRGGNCILLDVINKLTVKTNLEQIINHKEKYSSLLEKASSEDTMKFFFYSRIASTAIEYENK